VPGMQELVVIALVALFVLGPERLPEVMRASGRLLTRVRNYGVTASKELRGVADLGGLGGIEKEVQELRRELDRTRADLRRAMRETISSSSDPLPLRPHDPRGVTPDAVPDAAGAEASDDADAGKG
jgi:sec-independent protein translocase protein TatB